MIKWYGKEVFDKATAVNISAMQKACILISNYVKKSFQSKDVRSKQGETPAVDTGNLRASIMHNVERKGNQIVGQVGPDIEFLAAKTDVGTDVEYGLYLELGTKNMAPRPFLRPAVIANKNNINRIFKEANK